MRPGPAKNPEHFRSTKSCKVSCKELRAFQKLQELQSIRAPLDQELQRTKNCKAPSTREPESTRSSKELQIQEKLQSTRSRKKQQIQEELQSTCVQPQIQEELQSTRSCEELQITSSCEGCKEPETEEPQSTSSWKHSSSTRFEDTMPHKLKKAWPSMWQHWPESSYT